LLYFTINHTICILLSSVFTLSSYSQAPSINLSSPLFSGNIANLEILGSPSAGSGAFDFMISGNILSADPSSHSLGLTFAWYLVNPCDTVDVNLTSSGTEFLNTSIDVSLNPTFHLGVWFDESGDFTAGAGDGANLNLLSSAATRNSSIKVAPEPTTGILSALSITALLFSRRRNLV